MIRKNMFQPRAKKQAKTRCSGKVFTLFLQQRAFLVLCAMLFFATLSESVAEEWLDCVIYPEQELQLGFGEAGLLNELAVSQGQPVTRGEPIARQMSDLERIRRDLLSLRVSGDANISAQKARIAFIQQRLERARLLAERNVSTDAQLQELDYEYVIAHTGLRQAQEDRAALELEFALAEALLARRTLLAPVDGVILDIFRRPGEYAERHDSVVKLGIMDPLRVRAFARLEHLDHLQAGVTVQVVPDAPFDESRSATISFVSTQIDPSSRTLIVEAKLPNPSLELPGGHRCRIALDHMNAP